MKNTLISVALFCSLPAAAEVLQVENHGFMIKNTSSTAATPQQVYTALTENVDNWWPKDHSWWRGTFSIDPVAGGCFCEIAGDKQARHMQIAHVAPPVRLVMEGGLGPLQQMGISGALTWSITPSQNEDATQITLTYNVHGISPSGFEELASVVDRVQASQLQALADYVSAGHTATP
ncbi:SRPBCC family protein [Alteromonas halophila]|uniref:ATPase n=1 Tax=Alteromonas halophila TaxID=516698 RepID=A0A918MWU2_9ALTE|nr:SRPBCC family protein [Alteromonas halophila]GGW77206.1 ATPase [Alteromonas halophila]